MPGQLDEISQAIGSLQATSARLTEQFDGHCVDDAERHKENLATLTDINRSIDQLNASIAALTAAVSAMQPVVAGYNITRWKAAGAMSLAVALLSVLGLLLEKMLGAAAAWLLDRLVH